ncbi:hypothetical protein GCM10010193_05440 [Kitasatospora atroaurantiaca]
MPAAGVADLEAVPAQHGDQRRGDPFVVLDEQQTHPGLLSVGSMSQAWSCGVLSSPPVLSPRPLDHTRPAEPRGRIVMLKFRSDRLT